ncbi:hypothetical protein K490DRAFT_61926 [Saccharata proteae CBS 121410]|uniref:Uncharacterized protein n=1 Tax=Saccharata proteae CBS 121410 TaxID=1314787 RepID=A0A9P4I126_9PEZI|nr:hypothetical protein K490DRAFT_61926 [Saccharata proteae CBS 121410]
MASKRRRDLDDDGWEDSNTRIGLFGRWIPNSFCNISSGGRTNGAYTYKFATMSRKASRHEWQHPTTVDDPVVPLEHMEPRGSIHYFEKLAARWAAVRNMEALKAAVRDNNASIERERNWAALAKAVHDHDNPPSPEDSKKSEKQAEWDAIRASLRAQRSATTAGWQALNDHLGCEGSLMTLQVAQGTLKVPLTPEQKQAEWDDIRAQLRAQRGATIAGWQALSDHLECEGSLKTLQVAQGSVVRAEREQAEWDAIRASMRAQGTIHVVIPTTTSSPAPAPTAPVAPRAQCPLPSISVPGPLSPWDGELFPIIQMEEADCDPIIQMEEADCHPIIQMGEADWDTEMTGM